MHAVSPFEQLVAALDCNEIVGEEDPYEPMDVSLLKTLVSYPAPLIQVYVQARFRLRENGAMLDDTFVWKLCTKALAALKKSAHAEAVSVVAHLTHSLMAVPPGRMYPWVGPVTCIAITALGFMGSLDIYSSFSRSHRSHCSRYICVSSQLPCCHYTRVSIVAHARVLSSDIDVKAVLADHANLVRSQFRHTYPDSKSLPQFENIKVTPLSRHVVPANGKPHCIVGGVRNGPDLVLDSWNHPPSPALQRLRTVMACSDCCAAVGVGLPGSGKTTAATQLADDHVVVMVTASSWDDGTLPHHHSRDWRQLLELAQAWARGQSATPLAENEQWVRMAWMGLVYTRLVMYQAFLDVAQGTTKQQLRQWLLVQQEFNFTQLKPVASKLQPSTAVVDALASAVRAVVNRCSRSSVIVVIDEAQRVNDMFPLKLPRMDVRIAELLLVARARTLSFI